MNYLPILQSIHSAIDKELKTVKRYGATSRITLFSGKKSETGFSQKFLYRFEMLIQRNMPDGSQGNLVVGNTSVEARVTATEGQFIWLEITKDFGKRISQAYYDVDFSFLLEDLKEKYGSFIDGNRQINNLGANLIMGIIPEISGEDFITKSAVEYLSTEQIRAIDEALTSEISAIHGPPGTGKTRTLAGALVECFENEEKVLVCAHTNKAVDEALNAFKKASLKCIPESFRAAFKAGKILRKGMSVFVEDEPKIPNPEEVAERYRSSLSAELDRINKKIRDTKEVIKKLEKLFDDIKERDRLKSDYDKLNAQLKKASESFNKNEDLIKSLNNMLEESHNKHSTIQQYNLLRRFLNANERKKLARSIETYQHQIKQITDKQQKIIKQKIALKDRRKKIVKELSEIQPKTGNYRLTAVLEKIHDLMDKLEKLKKEKIYVEQMVESADEKVINNALLLFATLSRCHIDSDIYKAKFDRVFIDEASMASLPPLFLAGLLAEKGIHIFGDPKQLAPICISNKEEVRQWFSKDIYQYAGLTHSKRFGVSELNTQRRMPIELGQLVSELFYNNKLQHKCETEDFTIFPWMENRKVALLDTSNQGPFCNRHEMGRGYSRVNVVHAVIGLSILKNAEKEGLDSSNMAFITPYRAQAEFFGALVLNNRKLFEKNETTFLPDLKWGTVHKFQGGEADLVVYDTCESPRQLPTRLTGGNLKIDSTDIQIDDSSRLHCVGLSRAKSHLLILANVEWLRQTLQQDCKLRQLLEKISNMGSIIPIPKEHSALHLFSKGFSRSLFSFNLEDAPYVLCDEGEFYGLLEKDFEICKKKMIIVSPYLTYRRISMLEQSFRVTNASNVKTKVWTKHPSDLPTTREKHENCAKYLKDLGAKVFFRSGTHEKAIIIDDEISYYGSLNPLSHRNTKETMFRIKDKAFARTLIDHLDLDEKEKESDFDFKKGDQSFVDQVLGKIGLKDITNGIDQDRARKALKRLRWVIAQDKGLPMFATLWNQTIEWLVTSKPEQIEDLTKCKEFSRNRTNISGYENVLLKIVGMIA